jgi:hypothetical protein
MDLYNSIGANEFHLKGLDHFGIKELLEEENINWDSIRKKFRTDLEQFEELLFKVHYKRNKSLTTEKRSRILNFLSVGYLATNDVRYFNEFLWFYKDKNIDKPLMMGCKERFALNLNENGTHRLPAHLNQYPLDISEIDFIQSDHQSVRPLRICLIGFPPFFGLIIKNLKKEGHHIEQFFLPYHPNRLINLFLKFRLAVKVLSLLEGNFYSYRTLNFDYKDEMISQILKEGNFDIGFHKLNFIIKCNIFSTFRIGLLNDHWGYLPLLRGKSTIAYSLLLNIPVIPTIHFINKGIDSGSIIGYYSCEYGNAKSVKEVRHILRKTMPERVINAIKQACSEVSVLKENKKEAGATFYEIHPWLNNHIASNILKH